MAQQRIKGQETNVIIASSLGVEDQLTEIMDCNFEDELEILQNGFLGRSNDDFDYVYKGTKGDMKLHIHTSKWFAFRKKIKDKAQRKTPDTVFNITTVMNFPNGERARILFPDIVWGPIPTKIPSRTQFVEISLSWACGGTDDS